MRPLIGIAPDVAEPKPGSVRVQCGLAYADAVFAAGGVPVILPARVEMIPEFLSHCDGFVITGGDDPQMEEFGEATHPKATPMHPVRQAFDVTLLRELQKLEDKPTLGVCLGMQLMALVAGGKLDQHLPETLPTHGDHYGNQAHVVRVESEGRDLLSEGAVTSHHRQAVTDAGRLSVIARSGDEVIEGVRDPAKKFYVGVQWHPERTADARLGLGVIEGLVRAASGND
jgi:putative glutamine amidotransferase